MYYVNSFLYCLHTVVKRMSDIAREFFSLLIFDTLTVSEKLKRRAHAQHGPITITCACDLGNVSQAQYTVLIGIV